MRRYWFTLLGFGLGLTVSAGRAHANPVLLTSAAEVQLEAWLGQGDLDFTNIFEKQTGDDSVDFHTDVDGQGATFTLLQAIVGTTTYVIGGYNPQSWTSTGFFNLTPLDADRTAFLFDLSDSTIRRQKLTTDPNGALGVYQTLNYYGYGPTFGGGYDLWVSGNLSQGQDVPYSYGPGVYNQGDAGLLPDNYFCGTGCALTRFSVGALETYTFTQASVPDETASVSLLMLGMVAVIVGRRRLQTSVQPR